MNLNFKKEERIYKRDDISLLFEKGSSFLIHPFKVLHYEVPLDSENPSSIKFGVSIPKKKFKKAVDRNLLKRRSREAYRLNRNELKNFLLAQNKCLLLMVIYVDKSTVDYATIEHKIILTLQRLQGIYAENNQ